MKRSWSDEIAVAEEANDINHARYMERLLQKEGWVPLDCDRPWYRSRDVDPQVPTGRMRTLIHLRLYGAESQWWWHEGSLVPPPYADSVGYYEFHNVTDPWWDRVSFWDNTQRRMDPLADPYNGTP